MRDHKGTGTSVTFAVRPGSAATGDAVSVPDARALIVSAVAAAGFVLLYMVFVWTGIGQLIDATAMRGAAVAGSTSSGWMSALLSWISFPVCATAAVTIALTAAMAGRRRDAMASLAVSAGVPLTAEVLKLTLGRPHLLSIAAQNSFPSGTVAAAAALVGASVLASRSVIRRVLASIGSGGVAVIAVAVVVCSWHRPSDVLASLCLAVVGAGLAWPRRRGPIDRAGQEFVAPATPVLGAPGRAHR